MENYSITTNPEVLPKKDPGQQRRDEVDAILSDYNEQQKGMLTPSINTTFVPRPLAQEISTGKTMTRVSVFFS